MNPSNDFIKRLIQYYKTHDTGNCLPIWTGPYHSLRKFLSEENIAEIRNKLNTIYIDDLWGLDYNQINSWHLPPYEVCFDKCLNTISSELSLIPCTLPISDAHRLEIIKNIEKIENLDIKIPNFPNRPTHKVGDRDIPLRFLVCYHIFYCMRNNLKSVPKIGMEIGAGTGYLAYLFTKFYPTSKYYIIDLPIISVIQTYIYAFMNGEDKVWFHGEKENEANLKIYSPDVIDDIKVSVDFVINHNSFPEIPRDVQAKYLNKMKNIFNIDSFFYSVNWEPKGSDQTPTNIACEDNGFIRTHRRYFALEGKVHESEIEYFEELYKIKI